MRRGEARRRVQLLGFGALVLMTGLPVSLALAKRVVRHRRSARLSAPPRPPYRADFRRWWQGTDGANHAIYDAANAAYLWTPLDPNVFAWALWGDAPQATPQSILSVTAALAAGLDVTGYGIFIGTEPGYRVLVYTDGLVTINRIAADSATVLGQYDDTPVRLGGEENRLVVVLRRGTLAVTVNGQAVAVIPLPEPPRGPVSLACQLSHEVPPGSTTVTFRDLTVASLRTSEGRG